ncbi:transcription antitermination factor NusB [Halonatronum saccharophilum]|uniref:transcription antitermination factor NusB n=1 Tax=Halonatronum saccharophilum TaxID=150060 RepID=UPI0004883E1B|nr:transcription antitermination factor NusB [Halonatronum saccharophilum]
MKRELNRRQSREVAVQLLYQMDVNKESLEINLKKLHNDRPEIMLEGSYLEDILKGTDENIKKIDELVDEKAKDWKIDRIGKVDRNIIRLALYEILFEEDIPVAVAIDEAIELAKSFSDEKSAKFIHGVLGRIAEGL